jgi:RNA polymerase sigma-70 factor (ECF subfamily)
VDGERTLEYRLTYEAVSRIVRTLPEEQRSLLLLIAVEGLSYQEVSDALGVPIGTVAGRLARARMALKTWIEASSPEDMANLRETPS